MDTLDIGGHASKSNLEPLSGRWSFLWPSVIAVVLIQFYFFWAYSSLFTYISNNLGHLNRFGDGGMMGQRRQFASEMAGTVLHVGVGGFFLFCAQVCAIVATCLFFHRATKNLHEYGLTGLSYTPGWAVGWFFIPFVQLVMPLLVANQMWKGSVAIQNGQTDGEWKRNSISPWIILWYACFIGGILFYIIMSIRLQSAILESALSSPRYPFGTPDKPDFTVFNEMMNTVRIMFFGLAGFKLVEGIAMVIFTGKIAEMQTPRN